MKLKKIHFTCAAMLLIPVIALHAAGDDRVTAVPAAAQAAARCVAMEEVPLTAVRIQDTFWTPKLKAYRDALVPHAWRKLAIPVAMLKSAATPEKKPVQRRQHPYVEGDVHKILEAASCALAAGPDPELERRVDELIAVVGAAQQSDGYVDAFVLTHGLVPWSVRPNCHEDGYVTGFLLEGAVAHFRATGKKTYLDIARKAADCAWRHFVEQKKPGFPGHAEIEPALGELYRVTGEVKYLDLLRVLIEARGQGPLPDPSGYHQDHAPIRQQNDIRGHAVVAMFFAAGVADLGMETGEKSMCDAARRLWTSTTKRRMYVTGSVGSKPEKEAFGEDYELPNREGYSESCANCGLVNFAHRMLRLDGDAEAADVLELALYNAVLHGIALDGKSTYSFAVPLSDANHLRTAWGMCCASTLYRTLMQVGRYVYGFSENDLYVNLFVGGTGQVPLKTGPVTLRQETEYPWNGTVLISVEPEKEQEFALRVRIPGWSQGAALRINGEKIEPLDVVKGYAVIRRSWRKGDTVQMDLPMPVRRMEAHPRVMADRGKVTVQRGPIVYGLEALDNDGRVLVSLPADPKFQSEFRPDMLGGVTVIQGKTSDEKPFLAIPFYALANRGNSIQEVWLYQAGKRHPNEGWEEKLYREYLPFNQNPVMKAFPLGGDAAPFALTWQAAPIKGATSVSKATLAMTEKASGWKKASVEQSFVVLPRPLNHKRDGLFAMRTTVTAAEAVKAVLQFGADSPFAIWLNGKPVLKDAKATNPCLPDQYKKAIQLQKGKNTLLVAFDPCGSLGWGITARIESEEGKGLGKTVKY